jgi:hypothetical protein
MQGSKLLLTTWFTAFYLIGQAKSGIASLEQYKQVCRLSQFHYLMCCGQI